MPATCTLSSHSWPGALLSGGAARAPDHMSGRGVTEHQGICDILCCGHSGKGFPSSTSIKWASEIGATSVYCMENLNLAHVSFNVDTIY